MGQLRVKKLMDYKVNVDNCKSRLATYRYQKYIIRIKRFVTLRGLRLFIERGRKGYNYEDLWSFDIYIAKVLGNGLEEFRKNTNSYPGRSPWETPEAWDAYLKDLSQRLLHWSSDPDLFIDEEAYETTRAAVLEFGRNYGIFWD